MILRFLLVIALVYGTWELTGNRSLLLHNGISFIAGVIVATTVLALLTVFQIFIQYTLEKGTEGISLSIKTDPIKLPQRLIATTGIHILDTTWEARMSHSIDTFVASLVIAKLLLSWNVSSDWFGPPIQTNPIRLFFLLLFIVHLMATFVSIAQATFKSVRGMMKCACSCKMDFVKHFFICMHLHTPHEVADVTSGARDICFWMRQFIATWCGLAIVALLNSEFLNVIFDDASSSLSIHKDILVDIVKTSLTLATTAILGTTLSLVVPLGGLIKEAPLYEHRTWCTQRLPLFVLISVVVYLFSACILIRTEDVLFYTFQFSVMQVCCAIDMCKSPIVSMHNE